MIWRWSTGQISVTAAGSWRGWAALIQPSGSPVSCYSAPTEGARSQTARGQTHTDGQHGVTSPNPISVAYTWYFRKGSKNRIQSKQDRQWCVSAVVYYIWWSVGFVGYSETNAWSVENKVINNCFLFLTKTYTHTGATEKFNDVILGLKGSDSHSVWTQQLFQCFKSPLCWFATLRLCWKNNVESHRG